jgi:hypothetical protein
MHIGTDKGCRRVPYVLRFTFLRYYVVRVPFAFLPKKGEGYFCQFF